MQPAHPHAFARDRSSRDAKARQQRGGAFVEFAVAVPLLLVMAVGLMDLGRERGLRRRLVWRTDAGGRARHERDQKRGIE